MSGLVGNGALQLNIRRLSVDLVRVDHVYLFLVLLLLPLHDLTNFFLLLVTAVRFVVGYLLDALALSDAQLPQLFDLRQGVLSLIIDNFNGLVLLSRKPPH